MTDPDSEQARETIRTAMQARERAYANSPRHRSRWGEGLKGQRLPGHRIVVTEQTRRGHAKRHTFVLDEETESWCAVRRTDRGPARGFGDPMAATVHLAQGVDVPATTLAVILDALAVGMHHRIDLADLKRIVSQMGSRIAQLNSIPANERRIAVSALHSEILTRCSSM